MPKLLSNVGLFLSFLVILTITYLPVIQTNYLLADDYNWIWINKPDRHTALLVTITRSGRFLENYFKYVVYGSLNHFQSLDFARALRFMGIIFLSLLAYILTIIFKTNCVKTTYAFIGSILICSLPAFQFYVSWLNGIHNIVSAMLSALASLIIFKTGFNGNNIKSSYRKIAIFLSTLLLVSTLFLYQPATMIYFALAVIPLGMLRAEDLIRKWQTPFIKYFSVGFASLAIYFFIVKIAFILTKTHVDRRGELITLTEIPETLKWFIKTPLLISLNIWSIHFLTWLAVITGIIIILGFLPEFKQSILPVIREKNSNFLWNYLQKIFLIITIIPLSYLPSLVVTWRWAPFRTLVALETTVCILLFMSLLNIDRFLESKSVSSLNYKRMIIPILLFMLTIFAVYTAHNNVDKYIAKLQSLEIKYVEDVIQEYGISRLSETSKIYVTECAKSYPLHSSGWFWFEFGKPSSNIHGLTPMVKLALLNFGIKKKIEIVEIPANAPSPEGNNVLIIDCEELKSFLSSRIIVDKWHLNKVINILKK